MCARLSTVGGDLVTPYQRGHRDALLTLATELDRDALAVTARYPVKPGEVANALRSTVAAHFHHQAKGKRDAAALARRRAEALPHDPEEESA